MTKILGSEWVARHGVEFDWSSTGSQRDADGWDHNVHPITLTKGDRTLSFTFRTGLLWDDELTPSTVLPVFASEARDVDHTTTFDEWAGEFGYDSDSIRALRIFEASQQFRRDLYEFCDSQAMFEDFLSIAESDELDD